MLPSEEVKGKEMQLPALVFESQQLITFTRIKLFVPVSFADPGN